MTLTNEQVANLKAFYSVETDRELIARMDHHIAKLQAALQVFVPSGPPVRHVRQG